MCAARIFFFVSTRDLNHKWSLHVSRHVQSALCEGGSGCQLGGHFGRGRAGVFVKWNVQVVPWISNPPPEEFSSQINVPGFPIIQESRQKTIFSKVPWYSYSYSAFDIFSFQTYEWLLWAKFNGIIFGHDTAAKNVKTFTEFCLWKTRGVSQQLDFFLLAACR